MPERFKHLPAGWSFDPGSWQREVLLAVHRVTVSRRVLLVMECIVMFCGNGGKEIIIIILRGVFIWMKYCR